MRFVTITGILSFLFAALLVTAAPSACESPVGAIYFITNDVRGNAIAIHDVFSDGSVQFAGTTCTKGLGATVNRDPIIPDGLLGQGCVVTSGEYLFAVNPGSSTVSMFKIDPQDPAKLFLVGEPINSGGNFPTSLSVSPKNGNLCVMNGGAKNGVQCFSVHPSGLQKLDNTNRNLGINQTTPATRDGYTFSTSQVLFSEDGSKLFVSVKGSMLLPSPGYMAVWEVADDGSLSQNFTKTSAPLDVPGQAPFGMGNINGTKAVLVSDPVVGATIYDYSKGDVANATNVPIPGQFLSCWVAYSAKTNTYFLTSFGNGLIFEVAVDPQLNATVINNYTLDPTSVPTDIIVGTIGSNDYLYDLAPNTTAVNVLALQPGGKSKLIQSYNFTSAFEAAGVNFVKTSLQGMAVYIKH